MSIESKATWALGRSGARAFLLCTVGAVCGSANAFQNGHVWSHQSGGESWIGKVVSIGDDGTQVFSALGVSNSRARLFSTSDANPPTPIWEHVQPAYSWQHAVDSAEHAGVHAYLHYEAPSMQGPNQPVVRKHSALQGAPDWTWSFPFTVSTPTGGVGLSQDGSIVVGWVFQPSSGQLMVAGFGDDSGLPAHYGPVSVLGEPKAVRLSGDGSVLYVASVARTTIVDPLTGTVLYQKTNWEGVTSGHAISADGSVFAQVLPPNRVRVHERSGSGYVQTFAYELEGPNLCNQIGLSADGSLLACAFDFYDSWLEVRIQAFDLAREGQPMVVDDRTVGEGIYSNVASALAVAADGSAFVVGLWGDELGAAPELRAYRRQGQAWRLASTHDLPGSVNAVDISADGLRFAAASKAIHANQMGGGGRIDLYEVGNPDVTVRGLPASGSTVRYRHQTEPLARGRILWSFGLGAEPLPLPGAGMLYLDRNDLHLLQTGTADNRGVIETQHTLPSDPNMIGRSIYVQGLRVDTRRLSETWAKVTVLP